MSDPHLLHLGARSLDVSVPRVMGVVNTTTDSFFDGGFYRAADEAIAHGFALLEEGADIVDVGGESTRPGAEPVEADEELARVVPVVRALARSGALVSVDTMKPAVMRAAIDEGAVMINDVRALAAEGAMDAVAHAGVAVCLMHMLGEPRTMQASPHYDDVVGDVTRFLAARIAACEAAGIARERIAVDPGFGFGKTLAHNLALLRHLGELCTLGVPLLAGLSRKGMLGTLTGQPVEGRLAASVAAALVAVLHGAAIVRVHDVRATVDALKVWRAATTDDQPAPR